MTDTDALGTAISRSRLILSLLGPSSTTFRIESPTQFADHFRTAVFPLMRAHGVRRIFLMGTISIARPDDGFSLLRLLVVWFVRLVVPKAYRNVLAVESLCERDAEATRDVDWTVYRIAGIPGDCTEEAWRRDRGDGDAYVGPVGGKGWGSSQRRGALARWLVDAAEDGKAELVGAFPAVSRLAGAR